MVKTRRVASFVSAAFALGGCLFSFVSVAGAVSTSDKPAAILMWPKIVVDTSGVLDPWLPTDTIVQLSNTSTNRPKQAHCFLVNANGHCAEGANQPGKVCRDANDCPSGSSGAHAACEPGWTEIDFQVNITPQQPIAWRASQGLKRDDFKLTVPGRCAGNGLPCNPVSAGPPCPGSCVAVPSNAGSGIPSAPEDPFVGSLKCIQFDPTQNPPAPDQSGDNSLTGEAAIETCQDSTCTNGVDVQKYNAVGFLWKSLVTDHPGEVRLDGIQYEACPSTLILNHVFDGAPDPLASADPVGTVTTDLTLIPCGDDFVRQIPGTAVAQFLVFNEFEQRLSTTKRVDCFYERQLSLIDTGSASRSIFSFSQQGTLSGQTRIKGVGTAATGSGLTGVARVFSSTIDSGHVSGAGQNLQQSGNRSGPDVITIP